MQKSSSEESSAAPPRASGGKRKRQQQDPDGGVDSGTNIWTEDLHRAFVSAVYDIGLRHASPSVIIENMTSRPETLTSERVKSHLQKYRKNKEKSAEDFMSDYDAFMQKALTVGGTRGGASQLILPAEAMMEMMGTGWPTGGDIAGFLSYSVMTEENSAGKGKYALSPATLSKESHDYVHNFAGTRMMFPKLSEVEKRSPLGLSMVYVMGLFSSMTQHVIKERQKRTTGPTKTDCDKIPFSEIRPIGGDTELSVTEAETEGRSDLFEHSTPFQHTGTANWESPQQQSQMQQPWMQQANNQRLARNVTSGAPWETRGGIGPGGRFPRNGSGYQQQQQSSQDQRSSKFQDDDETSVN